ncbi:ATP-dependent acyl-CoA ligase [Roseomonas hellenica]|uniref:ATP-dependent acyl-CoA ligase n=1 Tax=Plastoroseomonas hellenica TaxID=2687306 RepID=A0ABS5EYV1_9PROT|nr:AMP-binding protein [Plastoroseomonas hellenica]MBR0665472.1 ATP-dependent acyl-CoA ligase [Plastoroseomonas hellenica]
MSPDAAVAMPPIGPLTLRQVMDAQALAEPERIFCAHDGQAISFGALDAAVNRIANGLLAEGLRPGDRVALMLPGHPDHIACILALAKLGLVRVPVNTGLQGASLAYPFDAFAVEALIADRAYADALAPVLAERRLRAVFWRGGGDGPSFEALLAHPDAGPPPVAPGADDILAITPSSGTTGAPKGVLKSDRTLRAGPMAILRLTEARPGDTLLFWEALHHGAGVAVVIAAILGRLRLGMVDRFSASRFWQQARESGATRVHYLGSVLPMVLRQPERPDDRDHGVRMAWGGGCPPEIWRAVEQRFGVEIREGYGLSELITFCTLNLTGKPGSIGRPLSWYEAMVADPEGRPLPPGEAGELCFRAKEAGLHFLGYFRNGPATAEAMRDGWFRTGDLARQDEEGDLFFVGRAKDSIRRRGINVSAWEVERVLLEHPAIEEVALIGVPSELGEDEIKIFVRRAAGATLDAASLLRWCAPRLPRFQLPRYVAFVADFPRTPTQRIRKLELPRDTAGCWDLEAAAEPGRPHMG